MGVNEKKDFIKKEDNSNLPQLIQPQQGECHTERKGTINNGLVALILDFRNTLMEKPAPSIEKTMARPFLLRTKFSSRMGQANEAVLAITEWSPSPKNLPSKGSAQ